MKPRMKILLSFVVILLNVNSSPSWAQTPDSVHYPFTGVAHLRISGLRLIHELTKYDYVHSTSSFDSSLARLDVNDDWYLHDGTVLMNGPDTIQLSQYSPWSYNLTGHNHVLTIALDEASGIAKNITYDWDVDAYTSPMRVEQHKHVEVALVPFQDSARSLVFHASLQEDYQRLRNFAWEEVVTTHDGETIEKYITPFDSTQSVHVDLQLEMEGFGVRQFLKSDFSVYPNPANAILTLQNYRGVVRIFYLLARQRVKITVHESPAYVNVKSLPDGVYLMEAGGKSVRFVIAR